ncbi:patatin-like phospholipase family protein [Mucilaginibacter xinganensis]|uniref:Patatin-like phospholipase n=1 Tax=Mucilaginibacter xinganensis TaxID=1234841 RepID=A0A223NU79_9SPHI|nr:patatin-like phospholipase family protein [Mucilaginibacter xinganensis]ASU33386.1 Patatin-like phospholipase [Mucilaginibacter xinganensis]
MDIVTDLTAEAASYLTVIQDICKANIPGESRESSKNYPLWDAFRESNTPGHCHEIHRRRIAEIVWSSAGLEVGDDLIHCFLLTASDLLNWLKRLSQVDPGASASDEAEKLATGNLYSSPFFWRQLIRDILYTYPAERKQLVVILQYMPVQIILALASKRTGTYKQRLYQVYNPRLESLLSRRDHKVLNQFWQSKDGDGAFAERAFFLLTDDTALVQSLNKKEVPLPFESLFYQELLEVSQSRGRRFDDMEPAASFHFPPPESINSKDPVRIAEQLHLAGLAFSGGGIRSATFNLGVLQKLAELGVLARFDYLSTVSGGGYIGTWFSSWIKRSGSLSKVVERLDTKSSPDPLADEVRPIKWLRMFSNFLSPNASIMSTDAWTMGITWLRNTLINQTVLLLILLTALSAIGALFSGWDYISNLSVKMTTGKVLAWSAVILLPGSFLAGSGMRSYNNNHPPQRRFVLGRSAWLAHLLIVWATAAAFLLTIWFSTVTLASHTYIMKLQMLAPGVIFAFLGMIMIAAMGRYHRFEEEKFGEKPLYRVRLASAILLTSVIASACGLALLAAAWHLIEYISLSTFKNSYFQSKLILIIGVPFILEAISISVVVRMALMGNFFPDERREWWGRMGALVHRFMIIWMLVTFSSLLLPDLFKKIPYTYVEKLPAVFGGWMAIIAYAVKLAFQSKTAGDKAVGGVQQAQEIFVRFAPYLFMLGFLLIGAYMIDFLRSAVQGYFPQQNRIWCCATLTLALAVLTFLLSWRVGVNEFSLHDFYRNRLVRAYLGATRRRTDRMNTANSFTGFDKDDDFPLSLLTTKEQYYGPYPIINTALNATTVSELDRQDRKAESFVFSPLYCGFDFSPTRSAAYSRNQVYEYGYRPTLQYSRDAGPLIGTTMAISGAAVSPNMGYHSSPATAFLLTVFNVRLGRWIGNPRLDCWKRSDPVAGLGYLIKDLIGNSDINTNYVCLSDGGHFDNMGLYELVRRKCNYILLGDAEEDEKSTCEGLANAIRRCRIDFGAEIELDVSRITNKDKDTRYSKSHVVQGTIKYPGKKQATGTIIYIKTSLTGNESVDIREYFINNPEFPQQSTGDQFFDEAQFESYRKLGYHSIQNIKQLRLP